MVLFVIPYLSSWRRGSAATAAAHSATHIQSFTTIDLLVYPITAAQGRVQWLFGRGVVDEAMFKQYTYLVDVSCLKGKSLISFFYRYFLAFFTDLQLCDECSSLLSWSRYHYYGVKQLILAVCYRYVGFAPKLSWFYTLRPNTYQNPIKSTSCSPRGVC